MAKQPESKIVVTAEDRASATLNKLESKLGEFDNVAGGAFGSAATMAGRLGAALPLSPVGLLGSAMAVAGGKAATMAHDMSKVIKENKILADSVDLTYQEFMRTASAFETVGLSAEETQSIIQDTNDKLGDFAATGGGALKDAFEAVGASAGSLRDDLVGLSGTDALQAVKNHMDDLNLSSNKQTFVLESLASNSQRLRPLLEKNGQALGDQKKRYDDLNGIMEDETIKAAEDYQKALKDLTIQFEGLKRDALTPMLSTMADGAGTVSDFIKEFKDEENALGAFVGWVQDINAETDKLNKKLFNGQNRVSQYQSTQPKMLGVTTSEDAGTEVPNPFGKGATVDSIEEGIKADKAAEAEREKIRKEEEAKKAAETAAFLDKQKKANDQLVAITGNAYEKITANHKKDRDAVDKMLSDGLISQEQHSAAIIRIKNSESNEKLQLMDQENTAVQEMLDKQTEMNEQARRDSLTSFERMIEDMEDQSGAFDDMVVSMTENFTQGFGDAFSDAIMNSEDFGDAMESMFKGIIGSMLSFVGEWIAQQIIMAVFSKSVNTAAATGAATAKTSEAIAAQQMAALNAFQSVAAIPVVGAFMAPAAAAGAFAATAPFVAGVSASMAAAVGGYAAAHGGLDYVPNEQTYLLQRGERVLSPKQNQDLTNYMANGSGGGDSINITVNGGSNTDPEVLARAIERTLRKRNKRTDRAIANSNLRGNQNLGRA